MRAVVSFFGIRSILFTLIAFSWNENTCAQLSQRAGEIEDMYDFISHLIKSTDDTAGIYRVIDSIAKEGDAEKTDWARYIVLSNYCDINKLHWEGSTCLRGMVKEMTGFNSPAIRIAYKFSLGEVFCSEFNYSTGMDMMLEALSEYKSIGYKNVPLIAGMFYLMSNRYYHFKNYRRAIDYAALSAQYHRGKEALGLFNTWGLAYQQLGLYDSAALKFKETMRLAVKQSVPVWEYIAGGNLGRTFFLEGKFSEGITFLRTDVLMDSATEQVNAAISSLYLAETYIRLNQQDSASYYINLSRSIFERRFSWGSKNFLSSKYGYYYYFILSKRYEAVGDYLKALKYSDTATTNERIYNSQFDWELLSSAEKRIEGLEYQQQLALLDAEKRNERLQKIILFIVLASLLILSILVVNRQRLKMAKEKQVAKEREANYLLQQAKAEQELLAARQQLDDLVKSFEEKERYKESITTELLNLKESGEHLWPENFTNKLMELVETSILTQSDWQLFRSRFEKVYPGFFAHLLVTIPDLSPAEERLLALAKLRMVNRQMASMLGISAESVRKAKYRLRKKLSTTGQMELLSLLDESTTPI